MLTANKAKKIQMLIGGVDLFFIFTHSRWKKDSDKLILLKQIAEFLNSAPKFQNPIGDSVVNQWEGRIDTLGRGCVTSMFPETDITMYELMCGMGAFRETMEMMVEKLMTSYNKNFGVEYGGLEVYTNKKILDNKLLMGI